MARLAGRLYDIKYRLSLTFEIKRAAAVSEIGIVGNVVVGAVIATLPGVKQPVWHECFLQHIDLKVNVIISIKSIA
ncbi:MAG: hypothetical protein Q7T38_09035 [Gallionella sp.]|nr:hypothetical protein [Gallionella sp.]